MTKTRTGKIARLPRNLRNKLNYRLANGEPANELVRWLNGLPETRIILAALFEGREINEQNLSDWKTGGHQDWLARQELLAQARELASDARDLAGHTSGALADQLAYVLKLRYVGLLDGWNGEVTDEFKSRLRLLGTLNQQISSLRRADREEERQFLARQKYEQTHEKLVFHDMDRFRHWENVPETDEQFEAFNLPNELKRFTPIAGVDNYPRAATTPPAAETLVTHHASRTTPPGESCPIKGARPSRAQQRRQSPTARNSQKPPLVNPLSQPDPATPNQTDSSPIKPSAPPATSNGEPAAGHASRITHHAPSRITHHDPSPVTSPGGESSPIKPSNPNAVREKSGEEKEFELRFRQLHQMEPREWLARHAPSAELANPEQLRARVEKLVKDARILTQIEKKE